MARTIGTSTSFAWCRKNTTARTAKTQRATFRIPPRAFRGGSDNVAVVSGMSKTEDVGSSIKYSGKPNGRFHLGRPRQPNAIPYWRQEFLPCKEHAPALFSWSLSSLSQEILSVPPSQ